MMAGDCFAKERLATTSTFAMTSTLAMTCFGLCYTFSTRKEKDMTQLELAISEIEKLPPDEQNQFAAWILEELHSEQRWSKLFARSGDVLSDLADEALAEHRSKKSVKLAPESL
jgi:hypothetical protein